MMGDRFPQAEWGLRCLRKRIRPARRGVLAPRRGRGAGPALSGDSTEERRPTADDESNAQRGPIMERTTLGTTGISIQRLWLGGMSFGKVFPASTSGWSAWTRPRRSSPAPSNSA